MRVNYIIITNKKEKVGLRINLEYFEQIQPQWRNAMPVSSIPLVKCHSVPAT